MVAMAFDPVQSLLAVATETGEVHVYGKQQVEVVFTLKIKAAKAMRFVKGVYLVVVDRSDGLTVISLHRKCILASIYAPGKITAVEVDPSVDWMLLGLQNGSVIVYDVDRDVLSPYMIENLQKSTVFPRERSSPVVSIQWHPRELGTLLIAYERVVVTYSLVENCIKQQFVYELPPGAPGGDPGADINKPRAPFVVQALYHPNGLHILTVHADNSLVFWDANNGELIQARTLFDMDVHVPGSYENLNGMRNDRIKKVAWICDADPEKTSLLIAGGTAPHGTETFGLTMLDFGTTPKYSVTSYEKMSHYYSNPVRQKSFMLPSESSIVDFLPLPRKSPYFAGNHDPSLILVLLANGELDTLLYPSGNVTHRASLFPQSLSWVRPTVTVATAANIPTKQWLGMMSCTYNKDHFLKGGAQVRKTARRHYGRTAFITGHSNGSVRIWDASHRELEETSVFNINVAQALGTTDNVAVEHVSFAAETAELAVSVSSGDVLLYKFQDNPMFNPNGVAGELDGSFARLGIGNMSELLVDVSDRAPSHMKVGFCPLSAVRANLGKVSAVTNSNIGFVAVAYEDGSLLVIDRRKPAVIYMENLRRLKLKSAYVKSIEFSIMAFRDDGYSSILLFCGTDAGELLIFKVLPELSGRFVVNFVDNLSLHDQSPILKVETLSIEHASSCQASIGKMQELKTGTIIRGCVVLTSGSGIQLITDWAVKPTCKSFSVPLATTGCAFVPYKGAKDQLLTGIILIALQINSEIKLLSLPDLKELKTLVPPTTPQAQYLRNSSVLHNGDLMLRVGPAEAILFSILPGQSQDNTSAADAETDVLYNPKLHFPARPHVGALQWARGSMLVKCDELAELLSGGNRPPPKYPESKLSSVAHSASSASPSSEADQETQYQAPMKHSQRGNASWRSFTKSVQNGIDYLEDSVNDYAAAANKSMNDALEQTRKDIVKGAFKSKMGI